MRAQTKKMLNLLTDRGRIDDIEATKAGITNPRREVAVIKRKVGRDITTNHQTDKKREYTLLES
ncbi:hypothetical protein [Fodinibius sp. SL11]|uniref:hypothetical protein n=1 Tax=Fodinibius sp. SL11 TaxID=3425690 RepID=UPI003F884EAA